MLGRLEIVAQVKLRSPAVQISVSEPLICVSCAMDSVLVIKYENGRLFECFRCVSAITMASIYVAQSFG